MKLDFTPSDEIDNVEIKVDGHLVPARPKMTKHVSHPVRRDESQTFSKMMNKLEIPEALRNSHISSQHQTNSSHGDMNIRDFIRAC